jgi:rhodanese-related sulfurtransferase
MKFFEDLMGGVLIILAAGVIAVAQNAVRDDKIPLIPKAPAEVSEKPYTSPSSSENSATGPRQSGGAVVPVGEGATPALLTEEELASGEVSRERVKELLEDGRIVLIDARATGEYEIGHITGAISVPYEALAEHYDGLIQTAPLDAMVVCYCRSVTCDDSENLARELKFMGYRNVVTYKGGWDEWSQAGYPMESSNPRE